MNNQNTEALSVGSTEGFFSEPLRCGAGSYVAMKHDDGGLKYG